MKVLVACSPGEQRVLAWDGQRATDAAVHRPGAPDQVGAVWRGRVTARVPALAGAFIDLDGVAGFLPDSAGGRDATEGAAIGVRVVRAALGGKGPRLTAALAAEDAALVSARSGWGLVRPGAHPATELAARLAAPIAADDPLVAHALGARRVPRAFDDAAEQEWESLAETRAALPGGGMLHIHVTPALTALDCDLGAAAGQRAGKAATAAAANQRAMPEVARQIRLRNLSGAILLDLIGIPARRRPAFAAPLAAALAVDPLAPRLLGFTALGFAEISRPRIRPAMHEVLAGPHAALLAGLRRALRDSPGGRQGIAAHPAVAAALDHATRADWQRLTGRPLVLRADPSLAPGHVGADIAAA